MKKFLLATAAVFASSSAFAADYGVVHPFYTPAKGKTVSITSLEYAHYALRAKDSDSKFRSRDITFAEEVKFGLTDEVQIGIDVAREWEKNKIKLHTGLGYVSALTRDYTNTWGIKAGYNIINDGKAFLNASLKYSQSVERSGAPLADDDQHGKFFDLQLTGGYNLDAVTVFGSIGYTRQVDGEKEVHELGGGIDKDPKAKIYTLEAGVFSKINDQISARTSLSVDIEKTKDEEERGYWWNAGVDYSIAKNMAVGLNAAYQIKHDIDDMGEIDNHRAYKLGVDFTIEF